MRRKYETKTGESSASIRQKLCYARRERRIYVIANLISILRHRGLVLEKLSANEARLLLQALHNARFGKVPLADWLPRGYQIARIFYLIATLLPERKIRVTLRDRKLIRTVAKFYRDNPDRYNKRQLKSLVYTSKMIGVKVRGL